MRYAILAIALLTATARAEDPELGLAMKMYSSERAYRVGDLITVIVDEAVSSSKSEDMNSSRTSSAGGSASFGTPEGSTLSHKLNKALEVPQANIDMNSSFVGKGGTTSSEALQAQFTVRVVDVLDNGLMLIRGSRRVQMKTETADVVLTGLIRQRDIENDNTILSSRISDAEIRYESDGEVSRHARPGWMWRIFTAVYPF